MGTQFMAWSVFAWLVGGLVGAVFEGVVFNTGNFNALLQFQVFRDADVNLGIAAFSIPIPNLQFFGDLMNALKWESALWTGWASYIRLLFLMAISVAFFLPLLLSLFTGRLSRA